MFQRCGAPTMIWLFYANLQRKAQVTINVSGKHLNAKSSMPKTPVFLISPLSVYSVEVVLKRSDNVTTATTQCRDSCIFWGLLTLGPSIFSHICPYSPAPQGLALKKHFNPAGADNTVYTEIKGTHSLIINYCQLFFCHCKLGAFTASM